ncbi:MAG: hypothetical protein IJP17_04770, partial [Clostridia bacterium]|nr:hypothetical protein [Clostridia bacterium]
QDAIDRTLSAMRMIDSDWDASAMSYYLSFICYHNRWETEYIMPDDLLDPSSPYLGFFMNKRYSLDRAALPETSFSDIREPLDDISEYYLYELLDYLKDNDIEALFVDSPHAKTYEEVAKTNTLLDILEQEGFAYINYNTEENWEKYPYVTYREGSEGDFYNDGHTNYNGALKYTTYFSAYLDENYDLPDRREDASCACWHGVTDAISEQISQWRKESN